MNALTKSTSALSENPALELRSLLGYHLPMSNPDRLPFSISQTAFRLLGALSVAFSGVIVFNLAEGFVRYSSAGATADYWQAAGPYLFGLLVTICLAGFFFLMGSNTFRRMNIRWQQTPHDPNAQLGQNVGIGVPGSSPPQFWRDRYR